MQWKPWAIIFVDTRYNSLSTIPHKINRSSGITDFIFVCLGVSKTFGFLPIFALPDLNSSHCFRLARGSLSWCSSLHEHQKLCSIWMETLYTCLSIGAIQLFLSFNLRAPFSYNSSFTADTSFSSLLLGSSLSQELKSGDLDAMKCDVSGVISHLTTGKLHHLQLVKTSPAYVNRLVESLVRNGFALNIV